MRRSSPARIKLWSERLARIAQSNQSAAAFCRSEGFSQPSSYQWKKKLASVNDAARTSNALPPTSSFGAVELRSVKDGDSSTVSTKNGLSAQTKLAV